jgi:hypothetical protein
MAARGAILAFAAAGVAVAALSSPAAAQADPDATDPDFHLGVWWQQRTIDEIEAELAGLEAAARWDGDPCAKIHRGATKLEDRLIDEEFLASQLPLEMIRAWRARVDNLLKICPDEAGFIGDPLIFRPVQPEQPDSAPPITPRVDPASSPGTAEWKAKQTVSINKRLAYLEALPADRCEYVRGQADVILRVDLGPAYDFHFPVHVVREWKNRAQRLIVICDELEPPQQTTGGSTDRAAALEPQLDQASSTLLSMHNQVRAEAGVPPLQWHPQLAAQAAAYGPQLAQYGRPVHAPRQGRETSRENLMQALPGTPVSTMVNVWIAERRHFRPGTFPNVSRTGNWADVGHFTQMIWPTTTHLGCAVHRGGQFDWLICRYSPAGNKDGQSVGLAPPGN